MREKRLSGISEELRKKNLDAIFLAPSTDLEYATGLSLFADARTKGIMISKDGKAFALIPLLYREEMENAIAKLPIDVAPFIWADHEGFRGAYAAGCAALGITGKRIAVNDGLTAVDMLRMSDAVKGEYVDGADVLVPLRSRKTAEELDIMRQASAISDKVLSQLPSHIKKGMTEAQVIDIVHGLYMSSGADDQAFSTIAASGPNGSMPHYAGNSRVLQDGDFLIIDSGCHHKGYCSDSTRTFAIGEPSDEQRKVYEIVKQAQMAGEAAVKKGATGQDVDRAARKIIVDAGYGDCFLNRLGHGIGVAIHENPYIIEGNNVPLEPGNVFSIEPGIYIPGKFGVRIENLVAVREDGTGEALNKVTRDMIVIK